MLTPRDVLTPDAVALLQAIAGAGSFAAAARARNMVPGALTYRVRQVTRAAFLGGAVQPDDCRFRARTGTTHNHGVVGAPR